MGSATEETTKRLRLAEAFVENVRESTLGVMQGKNFSAEALAVLDAGRDLWHAYFAKSDVFAIRDELKLNRPDVGWYQIRNALKKRNEAGDDAPIDFKPFEAAYKALTEKLVPQVYALGFLKE